MDADLHLVELRRIAALLQQLLERQQVASQRAKRLSADEALAMRQVFEFVGSSLGTSLFSLQDLQSYAAERPGLADSIAAIAGPDRSAKRLGKAFARAADNRIGDFVLRRIGRERSGVVWMLERISVTARQV